MHKKHAPTEVLIFLKKIIHKKEFGKKLNNKTVTLHCYCGVNVKYEFLSKTLLMKATICRLRKCQAFTINDVF